MSDSEEEDEYTDKNKVYDSDSDAEEEEINEKKLPADKKRVLDFFNEATEPELVAIQGKVKTCTRLLIFLSANHKCHGGGPRGTPPLRPEIWAPTHP